MVSFGYMVTDLMIERYAATKNKKVKISAPWDRYPDLFSEEKEIYEKEKAVSDLEEYKERRRRFAEQYNDRIRNAPK